MPINSPSRYRITCINPFIFLIFFYIKLSMKLFLRLILERSWSNILHIDCWDNIMRDKISTLEMIGMEYTQVKRKLDFHRSIIEYIRIKTIYYILLSLTNNKQNK
jgi:hypothetical protein